MINVDWRLLHKVYRSLTPIEQQICSLIGISEDFIVMYSQGMTMSTGLKRDVIFNTSKDESTAGLMSSISDFKAFADVNKELIVKMRHQRFYSTLLLKDMLNDYSKDEIQEFYKISNGDI